jgi:hypothetical protein
MQQRMNVKEQIILTDTVLVSKWVGQMTDRPQGWFSTFADCGAAAEISFFNVRNNSVGIAWNNQDARDQLPYPMRIMSIGVKFLSPACVSMFTACTQQADNSWLAKAEDSYTDPAGTDLLNREELHAALWEADIPNHMTLQLKTNQDIRLQGPVALFAPGYGAVGGGWGWGSPGLWNDAGAVAGEGAYTILCGTHVTGHQTVQHGEVDVRSRFPFPINLDMPKRANLSVVLRMSQYARDMLQAIPGPFWHSLPYQWTSGNQEVTKTAHAALFGIQVTIQGERLVQQRGDYAAL